MNLPSPTSVSKAPTVSTILKRSCKSLFAGVLAVSAGLVVALPSLDFITGKALFEKQWVFAPASTTASDGLGPYFNARSCHACHAGGGRGTLDTALVVHTDDPVYGRQLQKFTRPGVPAETGFSLVWQDGPAGLRQRLVQFGAGHDTVVHSLRLAPSLAGAGLLAAIPDAVILALADATDADGDGISGRVNRLSDGSHDGAIGRFGWKASRATLADQVGRALSLDLGLGNPVLPAPWGDCTASQTACLSARHGNTASQDNLEVSEQVLQLLLTYVAGLPAPRQTGASTPQHQRGAAWFAQVGCGQCHRAEIDAGDFTLAPYTDLLLHDMGPGLADELAEGAAAGNEWRTAPLWGLGNIGADSGYLHDGRAATLAEAIAWHGGEAGPAREAYFKLNEAARRDLITFLNGL